MTAAESLDVVRGDATGLLVPVHSDAFRAAGAEFLTEAFRAFGAIALDNCVARIVSITSCSGGSTGDKLFLTIEYERAEPDLHTELFVKFSRDFADPLRDKQRFEMEAEARFAAISTNPDFPIATPKAYFADFHHQSGSGLVITQRIFYGQGGVERQYGKCLDHELADPLSYYRALITALARLAGAHKAGKLGQDIEQRFPYDPKAASSDPIRYNESELIDAVAVCADFAKTYPHLLPDAVRTPGFIAQMKRDALRLFAHQDAIQAYLRGDSDFIALCHWNAHIDNAWFWRDGGGQLHCGLIDWGRVSQISFASALWGCLSGAHHDIWARHLDELLALFVREYRAHGGPMINVEDLKRRFLLHVGMMGVARLLAFPNIILHRLPMAASVSGPDDPEFLTNERARCLLHIYTVFLNVWRAIGFSESLDEVLG